MTNNYCTRCGAKLEPDDRFCRQCSEPVSLAHKQPSSPKQSNRWLSTPAALILLVGGIVLIVAALTFVLNRPVPAATVPDNHDEASIPYPEVERITAEQAKARYDEGTAVFVDVRDREAYEAAHVSNAVSIPLGELAARYQELPQDAVIITYCT